MTDGEKHRRTSAIVFSIIAVLLVCIGGYFAVDALQRSAAVNRIVQCAHEHGENHVTGDDVDRDLDEGIHQTGKGWRAAVRYAALANTVRGDAIIGKCYIAQQTLFGD